MQNKKSSSELQGRCRSSLWISWLVFYWVHFRSGPKLWPRSFDVKNKKVTVPKGRRTTAADDLEPHQHLTQSLCTDLLSCVCVTQSYKPECSLSHAHTMYTQHALMFWNITCGVCNKMELNTLCCCCCLLSTFHWLRGGNRDVFLIPLQVRSNQRARLWSLQRLGHSKHTLRAADEPLFTLQLVSLHGSVFGRRPRRVEAGTGTYQADIKELRKLGCSTPTTSDLCLGGELRGIGCWADDLWHPASSSLRSLGWENSCSNNKWQLGNWKVKSCYFMFYRVLLMHQTTKTPNHSRRSWPPKKSMSIAALLLQQQHVTSCPVCRGWDLSPVQFVLLYSLFNHHLLKLVDVFSRLSTVQVSVRSGCIVELLFVQKLFTAWCPVKFYQLFKILIIIYFALRWLFAVLLLIFTWFSLIPLWCSFLHVNNVLWIFTILTDQRLCSVFCCRLHRATLFLLPHSIHAYQSDGSYYCHPVRSCAGECARVWVWLCVAWPLAVAIYISKCCCVSKLPVSCCVRAEETSPETNDCSVSQLEEWKLPSPATSNTVVIPLLIDDFTVHITTSYCFLSVL